MIFLRCQGMLIQNHKNELYIFIMRDFIIILYDNKNWNKWQETTKWGKKQLDEIYSSSAVAASSTFSAASNLAASSASSLAHCSSNLAILALAAATFLAVTSSWDLT